MSNPESITVSLEWAKKLKAAGWPTNEGIFRWLISEGISQLSTGYIVAINDDRYSYDSTDLPAPTVEEILRRLPCAKLFSSGKGQYAAVLEGQNTHNAILEESAADAAAAMWLYLKENNLLDAETT